MEFKKALHVMQHHVTEDERRPMKLVVVVNDPGSIGGTPCVEVETVAAGFDWDAGKMMIFPSKSLTALSPAQVDEISKSAAAGQSWHAYQAYKKHQEQLKAVEAQRDLLLAALCEVERDIEHLRLHHFVDLEKVSAELAAAKAGVDTRPRYTSVSKGGRYTKLGAIRGAGSLKGLAGIAYQNEKGDLFIREPECFAKRMVLMGDRDTGHNH